MIVTRSKGAGSRIDRRTGGRVVNASALELLATLKTGTVGALVMDPPFFVSTTRDGGGLGDDPWESDNGHISDTAGMIAWSEPLAQECYRVLRPGGAVIVMGGARSISAWQVAADAAGLRWMAEITVLWNTGKPRARNFGSLTATIRWHTKPGARHTFNSGDVRSIYSNVVVCKKVPPADRKHPAQKPVELTTFLIDLLTEETDLVVDPFCGSGSTLVSAAMENRPWLGGDTDLSYCCAAELRTKRLELEEAAMQEMFFWINGKQYPIEG